MAKRKPKSTWEKTVATTKGILTILMLYLSIAGLVTFSLFIMEEAFQTAMFGTWPAQDAQEWGIVKTGTELMTDIEKTMTVVTNVAGWIQPLAFISYRAYSRSAKFYVKGLRAKTFAHAPRLFIGEHMTFTLVPKKITEIQNNSVILSNRKLGAIFKRGYEKSMSMPTLSVSGTLELYGDIMAVDMR